MCHSPLRSLLPDNLLHHRLTTVPGSSTRYRISDYQGRLQYELGYLVYSKVYSDSHRRRRRQPSQATFSPGIVDCHIARILDCDIARG
jgi:hypothetical protein